MFYEEAAIVRVIESHDSHITVEQKNGRKVHLRDADQAEPLPGSEIILLAGGSILSIYDYREGWAKVDFEKQSIETTHYLVYDIEWMKRLFGFEHEPRKAFAATFYALDAEQITLAKIAYRDPMQTSRYQGGNYCPYIPLIVTSARTPFHIAQTHRQ